MFTELAKLAFFVGLIYFLWEKIFKMYHRYWYYTRQGVPVTMFPLPLVGSIFELNKYLVQKDEFQLPPIQDYLYSKCGPAQTKMVLDFRFSGGLLYVNSPEAMYDLYVAKNKFVEKNERTKHFLSALFGNSILFDQTTEQWAIKRKRLSSAFYKDKIIQMLQLITQISYQRLQEWKETYGNGKDMSLTQELQAMIMDCVQACVFGKKNISKKVQMYKKGVMSEVYLGVLVRDAFFSLQERSFWPLRILFPVLDKLWIGDSEKETLRNCNQFRQYVTELINERREELKSPDFVNQGDFLTMLLMDDYFKGKDVTIIEECVTFMFASTITTALTATNAVYRIIMDDQIVQKVRQEIKQVCKVDNIHSLTEEQWKNLLTYENLDSFHYIFCIIQETLRIDSTVRNSALHHLTEDCEIDGVKIKKGDLFVINMHQLHHNPNQWINHSEFIPERFDPSSPFYLTPTGSKRHPMSYGPFLGGKRICLGKTFAENVLKCLIPLVISQLDLEISNEIYKVQKPTNSGALKPPAYLVKVKSASAD